MAIKLSGSISRKVPIPGVEFSSQSFGASMEVEINSADAGEVQTQLAQLYDSLSRGIDAQISEAKHPPVNAPGDPLPRQPVQQSQPVHQEQSQPIQQRNGYATGRNRVAAVSNGNGNGNGRRGANATEAQCRAIFAICKSQGIDMTSVLADFNVADPKDLHVKDASRLIDQLKSGNGTAAH